MSGYLEKLESKIDLILKRIDDIEHQLKNDVVHIKTVTEFSKVIRVTPKTIFLWIKQGILEKSCIPRGYRVLSHYKEGRSHFIEYKKV